jgi:hypothetical protein
LHHYLRKAFGGASRRAVDLAYAAPLLARAALRGARLQPIQDRTDCIRRGEIILVGALQGQARRLPAFLAHYRRLGVRHFLLVDCGPTDALEEPAREADDVSVWGLGATIHRADAVNWLLQRFGHERWCVVCDVDERLAFPHCDERRLDELAVFLDSERRRSLFSIRVDLYPAPSPGEEPAEGDGFGEPRYFDATGYTQVRWGSWVAVQGGFERRTRFRDAPAMAPVLNRHPFVKWRRGYAYFPSGARLAPLRLNDAHAFHYDHVAPTGCLCRLVEPPAVAGALHEGSRRYAGWASLADAGLMSEGMWF